MTEDVTEIFAVVAEWKHQGPILMETEGDLTGHDSVREQMDRIAAQPSCLRVCVVRLKYHSGNALLLHDMKRMQK